MKIRAERVYLFGFTENNPAGSFFVYHCRLSDFCPFVEVSTEYLRAIYGVWWANGRVLYAV